MLGAKISTPSQTIDEQSIRNTTVQSFNVYPNPAKDFLYMDLGSILRTIDEDKVIHMKVYSTDGKLQLQRKTNITSLIEMNVKDLPVNQYYIINIETEGTNQLSTKFLKL